jgi:tetratricopeptide (TPR) repeat protein
VPPFGAPALAAAVPWRGEAGAFAAEWKVLEIEAGGVARLGLVAEVPTVGALPRRAAPDRLLLELSARPEDGFMGDGMAPRRYAVALVAEAGGARVERRAAAGEPGLTLDVWYEARVEYAVDPPRARVEVVERGGAEGPGGTASAGARGRPVFRAELPLPARLAAADYVLGAAAPPDEPEAAPATLFLRSLALSAPPAAAARAAPAAADAGSADFFRATAAAASGRAGEAAILFRRAIQAAPFLDAALFGEGLAARDAGDLLPAALAFAACARTTPRAREEFRRLAADLRTRGAREDLLSAMEAYLEVDPEDAAMKAAAGDARRAMAEALDLEAQAAADLAPARELARGRLYLRAQVPAQALACADAAAADGARTGDAAALLLRADAHAAQGEAAQAAVDYLRAAKLDKTSAEPLMGLARLYLGLRRRPGEHPEAAAEALLVHAEVLARDRPDVLVLRGRARLAQGKLAPARADADRAISLSPRAADAHALAAEVALREGRKLDARAALARALRLGPVDAALEAAIGRE